jgi:DNA adenine methylase
MIGNLGFQGGHPMTSRSYGSGPAKKKKLKSLLPAVLAWKKRMKDVEIEHVDAFDLLERYDNPEVFTFLDPPYHPETCDQDLYTHNDFDHRRFVQRLQKFKGRVLLCGYEHGLYDVQLFGWRRQEFHVSKSYGGRAPRTEVIWMNYDEAGKRLRQDFRLIQAFEKLPA